MATHFRTLSTIFMLLLVGTGRAWAGPGDIDPNFGSGGRVEPLNQEWINATTGQSLRVITIDEVVYFQADTKYTRVVTAEGPALVRMSLRQLQEQLDPSVFWQVHRSTIVNANAIASVARDFAGRVLLALKNREERLAVTEPYHHLFRQM